MKVQVQLRSRSLVLRQQVRHIRMALERQSSLLHNQPCRGDL